MRRIADNSWMPHSLRYIRRCLRACVPIIAFALVACAGIAPAPAPTRAPDQSIAALPAPALIPHPVSLQREAGEFVLHDGTQIHADPGALEIATWFGELVTRTRGLHLHPSSNANGTDAITFSLDPSFTSAGETADEAYALTVAANGIVVRAATLHGLFNGATTLWQLLTPIDAARSADAARVPFLHVTDRPRFAWRGLMLDSARHLQSVEYIEQFIDWMALHKYNVLHWHLTDDQGWRIEIKRYPKLTEVGAWRRPAGRAGADAQGKPTRYGGYYTQAQIRQIVAYAQARYVTIVPEIEMPGHAQAAVAAYPELGVTGKNPGVSHDWGVHTYLYNVEDSTFIFLQNVLSEVMELFPSPYIHIGGDEAAKDQWRASARVQARMRALGVKNETALQAYFTARIEKFLAAHGRKLIGWDEILEGGLPPEATVMSWRGSKGAVEASKLGHNVIMSPDPGLYLDHLQGALPDEPPGRPSVLSLADIYNFQVVPKDLDAAQAQHVLGAQANLWSEYLRSDASVAHAAFPRAAALAEALWSPAATHDWNNFLARLPAQEARYRLLGLPYAQDAFAVSIEATLDPARAQARVALSTQTAFGEIRYTLDGATPTPASPQYTQPFDAPATGTVRAIAFRGDAPLADARSHKLDVASLLTKNSAELAQCNPTSGVILKLPEDAPANATRDAFVVDIFDPCWKWPQAHLDGIERIEVETATLPYNFQLWHDAKNVVERKPATYPIGELQLFVDRCDGTPAKTVSIAPLLMRSASRTLSIPLADLGGTHDVCLRFATGHHDPMWIVRSMRLVPKA